MSVRAVVIDTNVPVVENGRSRQAGPQCVLACIEALDRARRRLRTVLDTEGAILGEYLRNVSWAGQPGVGTAFVKWLWERQADANHCVTVGIRRRAGRPDDYEEFPSNPDLGDFDASDRKFVAVAIASGLSPPIWNAVDSDRWNHREVLDQVGVRIEFLCADQLDKWKSLSRHVVDKRKRRTSD